MTSLESPQSPHQEFGLDSAINFHEKNDMYKKIYYWLPCDQLQQSREKGEIETSHN